MKHLALRTAHYIQTMDRLDMFKNLPDLQIGSELFFKSTKDRELPILSTY